MAQGAQDVQARPHIYWTPSGNRLSIEHLRFVLDQAICKESMVPPKTRPYSVTKTWKRLENTFSVDMKARTKKGPPKQGCSRRLAKTIDVMILKQEKGCHLWWTLFCDRIILHKLKCNYCNRNNTTSHIAKRK